MIREAIIALDELLFKMGFTTSKGPFPPIILLAPDNNPAAFILTTIQKNDSFLVPKIPRNFAQ